MFPTQERPLETALKYCHLYNTRVHFHTGTLLHFSGIRVPVFTTNCIWNDSKGNNISGDITFNIILLWPAVKTSHFSPIMGMNLPTDWCLESIAPHSIHVTPAQHPLLMTGCFQLDYRALPPGNKGSFLSLWPGLLSLRMSFIFTLWINRINYHVVKKKNRRRETKGIERCLPTDSTSNSNFWVVLRRYAISLPLHSTSSWAKALMMC